MRDYLTQRNILIAGGIILVIAVGVLLSQRLRNRDLPSGDMSQATPSPTTTGTLDNPIQGRPQVTISTSKGDITLELRPDVAPQTVANYLGKWSRGECNDLTWHRVEDWVVQGCDPKGDGTGGNSTLPTETSTESFTAGAVGVARKTMPKEVSNDSQFFIVKTDSEFLNGEYTYFGRVISGMDVVNSLAIGDKILTTQILSK